MPLLADIPVEVIIDNLLPLIPVPDLLSLASTNRFFFEITADNTFWKRKLAEDYNFTGIGTARTSGWKFIYRGLRNPRIFVWGDKRQGRLGLSKFPKSTIPDVPFPTEIRIPGVRIVSLVAGGMSFHALDSEGNLYVWGALDNSPTLQSDGFSEPGKIAPTPLRLKLPAATSSISCGRFHSTSLDINHHVRTFRSWGRPFRLSSHQVDNSSPDSRPVQVECGWGFSSLLTESGDVLVWWPFSGVMEHQFTSRNAEMDDQGDRRAVHENGIIPCVTWDIQADPVRLPSLPLLPELLNTGRLDDRNRPTRLIQIAAFDRQLIGLTNKGHVLKFGMLDDETTVSSGSWEYLPRFSELDRVSDDPTFSPDPPRTMQITHVSAHFRHFVTYSTGSSSIVLMGDTNTTPESQPIIIPALQNRSVISVVLGDYHFAAITSSGSFFSWGLYSRGALGLGDPAKLELGAPGGYETEARRQAAIRYNGGDPPRVDTPTQVRFDHGVQEHKDRFCFAATASGWHTGALVIDLEPGDDEHQIEDLIDDQQLGNSNRRRGGGGLSIPPLPPLPLHGPGQMPTLPITRGGGIFRIGFAGRGRGRG